MTDKKPTSIFLIGMMASGKSTVGSGSVGRFTMPTAKSRRAVVYQYPIFLKKKERRDFELGKRKCWLS